MNKIKILTKLIEKMTRDLFFIMISVVIPIFISGFDHKETNIIHENMMMQNEKKKDSTSMGRGKQIEKLCPPPYNITMFEGSEYCYDSLEIEEIDYGKKALIDQGYKFPSEEEFSKRILDVYGMDINEYPNKIIVLNNDLCPLIALKEQRYVLYEYSDNSEDAYQIDKELLYWYNDYIFHSSRKAYEYLLKKNNKQLLVDLVTTFGYTSNKELTDYVFNNYEYIDIMTIGFQYNPCRKEFFVRENVFDAVEKFISDPHIPDFTDTFKRRVFGNSTVWIEEITSGEQGKYHNPEKTIAYIFERQLRVGIKGFLIKHLEDSPDYEAFLKKNKYFGYPHLKDFMEKQF